ncbi:MAG: 50S ribosomal protein L6 [Planctomycetota bacterium]|jgi:large subunit ribosomal protein L6|nr:50S ribosomal protein L6 [Planctomycetota bacterium]
MSRVGKKPIPVLDGVKVSVDGNVVNVEGPKGKLSFAHREEVTVKVSDDGKSVDVTRNDEERASRAFHGLTRALVNNMVIGVKTGYEKKLEVIGVGYLAAIKGKVLQLRVGFANELQVPIPEGLEVTCPDQTHINVKGCNKQAVGQFAAYVRALRKPEPYKGKGVRYVGEVVKLKPGKSAT